MNKIKKMIPKKVKIIVGHYSSIIEEILKSNLVYIYMMYWLKKYTDYKKEDIPRVFLVNVPNHLNLGDQAIAVAERKFLEENFREYQIIEIWDTEFFKNILHIKRTIGSQDVFFAQGGGNMGIDYFWCERVRRLIIKWFPNNKIVILPQTIYFPDTKRGRKALDKSKKIYSKHKKLLICAREEVSYKILKREFVHTNVELIPDMVFYMQFPKREKQNTILLCFRDDQEKAVPTRWIEQIVAELTKQNYEYQYTDTVLNGNIPKDIKLREEILLKKLEEFATARLVVTDRLHGMLFSCITNTPCIVFGNFNHKVEETYKWIRENGNENIIFMRNCKTFSETMKAIMDAPTNIYDKKWMMPYVNIISEYIKEK